MTGTVYFAYGSNMDPEQMARRCPASTPLGIARLDGYRIAFTYDAPGWQGGVATILPSPEDHVWGVLWSCPVEDLAILDEYESVADGIYERRPVRVVASGGDVEAFAYVTLDDAPHVPNPAYVAALVRGARAFGIPAEYVAALEAVPTS